MHIFFLYKIHQKWAEMIHKNNFVRKSHVDEAKSMGYDLRDSVIKLESFYLK